MRGRHPSPCRVRTCASCGCFSWSLPVWCSWLWRGYGVVVPLVEVQVPAAPFGLPALRVDGLGAEGGFRRHERAAVVVVEGDAVAVEAAEIEACDGSIGVVEPAEGHVHRHPAVGRDVELAPVVQVP